MQAHHSSRSNDDGLLTTGLLAGTKPNKVRGDRHELKRLAGVAPISRLGLGTVGAQGWLSDAVERQGAARARIDLRVLLASYAPG